MLEQATCTHGRLSPWCLVGVREQSVLHKVLGTGLISECGVAVNQFGKVWSTSWPHGIGAFIVCWARSSWKCLFSSSFLPWGWLFTGIQSVCIPPSLSIHAWNHWLNMRKFIHQLDVIWHLCNKEHSHDGWHFLNTYYVQATVPAILLFSSTQKSSHLIWQLRKLRSRATEEIAQNSWLQNSKDWIQTNLCYWILNPILPSVHWN